MRVLWHRGGCRVAKCRPCAATSERWRQLWRQRSDGLHALQYGQRPSIARAVPHGFSRCAPELLRIRVVCMAQTHASRSGGARAARVQWGASGSRGGTPEGARLLLTLVISKGRQQWRPLCCPQSVSPMRACITINDAPTMRTMRPGDETRPPQSLVPVSNARPQCDPAIAASRRRTIPLRDTPRQSDRRRKHPGRAPRYA